MHSGSAYQKTRLLDKASALSLARYLLCSAAPAVMIFIICMPLLNRSAWIDEAMLYSNYPIAGFGDLFKPLTYYDQAAPPAYSLFASLVANMNTPAVRSISLIAILYSMSLALLFRKTSLATLFLAFFSIAVFTRPLVMYSEMKHYGLEAVGVIISLTWLVHKDAKEHLDWKDVFILSMGMFLGISTLITSVIAGTVYFMHRCFLYQTRRREILYPLLFLSLCLSYYLLTKNLTSIQLWNYPSSYEDKGVLSNAKSLASAISQLLGKMGLLALVVALAVLISNTRNEISRKVVMFAAATAMVFFLLSAAGLYPATHDRHVTWVAGLTTAIVFYGLYICIDGSATQRRFVKISVFGLALISANNAIAIWRDNFEIAENRQAILALSQLPKEKIGLWIGAQPILQYYKRIYPGINNHEYFGEINPHSAKVELPRDLAGVDFETFDANRDTPGAWALKHLNVKAFELDARSLISQAPRGQNFYIFAANCDLHDERRQPAWTANIINDALSAQGCTYKVVHEFKRAFIYLANCSQLD